MASIAIDEHQPVREALRYSCYVVHWVLTAAAVSQRDPAQLEADVFPFFDYISTADRACQDPKLKIFCSPEKYLALCQIPDSRRRTFRGPDPLEEQKNGAHRSR